MVGAGLIATGHYGVGAELLRAWGEMEKAIRELRTTTASN